MPPAVAVTERALLTSALRAVKEDDVVAEEEEVEAEEGGRAEGCCGVLLLCEPSCLPVDPPPFCVGLCLTTFRSSMWVSAVP